MNTTRQGDITGFDDAEVVDEEEQEEGTSHTKTRYSMERTEEVKDAIEYLQSIWGDYGQHRKAVEVLLAYIEELESMI